MKKYLVAKVWLNGTFTLCEPAAPMEYAEAVVFLGVNARADKDYNYVMLEVMGKQFSHYFYYDWQMYFT